MTTESLRISKAVSEALNAGRPVVALESTVITHGLPYPLNLETLEQLEATLLKEDVVPATIMVLDGIARVGIEPEDKLRLERAFTEREPELVKISMRDLALALATGRSGGTTVSATMLLAYLAGIGVFATGGIGGVHRGWQETNDISMDIHALATIPVTVVSAGCKAILDIGATLEALESTGVPVWGWQTDVFPTFYSSGSNFRIESIADEHAYARARQLHLEMAPSPCGILIANPIPSESELKAESIEPVIMEAVSLARSLGISGKALTPFLLDRLAQATKGESVKANLALLENNVRLAAKLAKAEQE